MDDSTLTGKTIGKYQIEERLGRGGMAEVYKGYQESLDRYVAIKIMHTFLSVEDDFLQRFKREARAMASLSHPNIVRIYDFDTYGQDSYYLVMEYIDGGTLKEELETLAQLGQNMPLEQSVKMMSDMADALAYAHHRGMIHRDIKPANIMLRKETNQTVLTDFGIVKLLGDQSMHYTATGALIGTPSYMSPEQALGKPGDERVDIYSLGVLLFQMVTNQLPFAADTPLAVVMKHVSEPAPLPVSFNPDIPFDLQEVVLKALAKNPDDRFQTAVEMAAALRAVNLSGPKATTAVTTLAGATAVGATAVGATAVSTSEPTTIAQPAETTVAVGTAVPASPSRKSPIALIVGGIILLAVIVGGILYATGVIGGGAEPTTEPVVAIVDGETNTPPPPTPEADEEVDATGTPDAVATQFAALTMDLTKAADTTSTPTTTATPSQTPSPTASPTEDATAAFAAACTQAVELVSATRGNSSSNGVFPGSSFPARWVLLNSGTCPWPEELVWTFVEGETFGYEGEPVRVGTAVDPDGEATITAQFTAPNKIGLYESSWQMVDSNDDPFGEPVTFSFQVVPRATATPPPSPTPAITATPTVVAGSGGQAAYVFSVETCDYPGNGPDWRCQIVITPYIDGGTNQQGSFTVFVFDLPNGQAAEYRGSGPFTHFVQSRRCATYNHEIRVIDDVTDTQVSGQLYIAPDEYFEGGCTLP